MMDKVVELGLGTIDLISDGVVAKRWTEELHKLIEDCEARPGV